MSANLMSVENHKNGTFTVSGKIGDYYVCFESMFDLNKYMDALKEIAGIEKIAVNLIEKVISPKKEMVYLSYYAY